MWVTQLKEMGQHKNNKLENMLMIEQGQDSADKTNGLFRRWANYSAHSLYAEALSRFLKVPIFRLSSR